MRLRADVNGDQKGKKYKIDQTLGRLTKQRRFR